MNGDAQSLHTPTLERKKKVGNSHKVAANQDMGTRMVMEAQTESGALTSQNVGGPLSVT